MTGTGRVVYMNDKYSKRTPQYYMYPSNMTPTSVSGWRPAEENHGASRKERAGAVETVGVDLLRDTHVLLEIIRFT